MALNILIADHDKRNLEELERLLKADGHQVTMARNGNEAMDLFKDSPFDLCIIDPMLSGIDGFTVCRQLTKAKPDLPVIIVTGIYKGDRYRRDSRAKYGAAAFFERPFEPTALLADVRRLGAGDFKPDDVDSELDETVRDTPDLDETVRDDFDPDDTVREEPKSDSSTFNLGNDLSHMLEGLELDLSKRQTDKKPVDISPGEPFGRFKTKPKAEGQQVSTMRIDPEDLQREMARIRNEKVTGKPEPAAEKTETPVIKQEVSDGAKAGSRVKVTQKEEGHEGGDGDTFTSNDIFGELIDDIEAGKIQEPPEEPKSKPVKRPRRKKKEPEPEPAAEQRQAFQTQPVEPEVSEAAREAAAKEAAKEARPVVEPESKPVEKVAEAKEEKGPTIVEPAALSEPVKPNVAASDEDKDGSIKSGSPSGNNEYQLLNKIAAGGMAEVWKAKLTGEKGFEKIVAIKKILPHLSDNDEFITMFIDEAKVAANLTHPNIAQIYELGKLGDSFFIAMEYVAGHNLRFILNRVNQLKVKMSPEVAVYITMKLCNALNYAHNKKGYDNKPLHIVHRDVSPQNILLSTEGEVKLVDFGIAKASIKATQTVAGSLKGKLLYMSPEQAEGKALDNRSDIFSLGSVLYEALTGRKMFSGDSELSILKNVRQAKFKAPREENPGIPKRLETILLKALTKDSGKRYGTCKALENDLKEWLKAEKIHINESDVSDYIKLVLSKDREKLEGFGSFATATEDAEAPVEKTDAKSEKAEAKPTADVVMPDPPTSSGVFLGVGEGSKMPLFIGAGVLILILILVLVFLL
jgi:serine/threonine protein kinase/DNA-binding response OmpR family regulator